jgi:hypothetical protein
MGPLGLGLCEPRLLWPSHQFRQLGDIGSDAPRLAVAAVEGVQAATGAGGTASESGANIEHNKCRWPTPYDALLMRKGLKRPLPTPQPHPWPLALLPTRDFVPVTL